MPDFLWDATCPKHDVGEPTREAIAGCQKCQQLSALAELRALCPPGTTVYTILRSVSRSGMSRSITPVLVKDGQLHNLTWLVAKALGRPIRRAFNDGVRCDGAGMDMGFDLVHSLSYALHGMENTYVPGKPSTTYRPGYTLNHRWL